MAVEFQRTDGTNGYPPFHVSVRLPRAPLPATLQFGTFHYLPRVPEGEEYPTLEQVLGSWGDLIDDLEHARHYYRLLPPTRIWVVFWADPESDHGVSYRTVTLDIYDLENADDLMELIQNALGSGSDPSALLVSAVDIQYLRTLDAAAGAGLEAKFSGSKRQRAGMYDYDRILAARRFQTNEWYANQPIERVENKGNNMCVFYCFAMHSFHEQDAEEREHKRAEKETKLVSEEKQLRDRVQAAQKERDNLSAITNKRNKNFRFSVDGAQDTLLTKRAKQIADLTFGEGWWRTHYKVALTLDDLVFLANKAACFIQVFSANEEGTRISLIWQSNAPKCPGGDGCDHDRTELGEEFACHPVPDPLPPVHGYVTLFYTEAPPRLGGPGHFDLGRHDVNLPLRWLGGHAGGDSSGKFASFCNRCLTSYPAGTVHECSVHADCGHFFCPAQASDSHSVLEKRRCDECGIDFYGRTCYDNHKRLPLGGKHVPVHMSLMQGLAGERQLPRRMRLAKGARSDSQKESLSKCDYRFFCRTCRAKMLRYVTTRAGERHPHSCDRKLCLRCDEYTTVAHLCYIQPGKLKETKGDEEEGWDYAWLDIESDLSETVHRPVHITVMLGLPPADDMYPEVTAYNSQGVYVGEGRGEYDSLKRRRKVWFTDTHKPALGELDCAARCVEFLLDLKKRQGKGFVIFAHNGGKYDWTVMFRALINRHNHEESKAIRPMVRGSSFIALTVGARHKMIRFFDSILHMGGKLKDYVKSFDLKPIFERMHTAIEKGNFPHWLCRSTHAMSYHGALPNKQFYFDGKNPVTAQEQKEFDAWYELEQKEWAPTPGKPEWVYEERLKYYCDQDVQILMRGMAAFRKKFMFLTDGADPLQYPTVPSACAAVWRHKFMAGIPIANFPPAINRILRRWMSGGRVEATRWVWPAPNDSKNAHGEQLRKVDVTSLYPFVMAEHDAYPTGWPEFFSAEVGFWPDGCGASGMHVAALPVKETLDRFLYDERTIAFFCLDYIAPKNVKSPIYGHKDDKNKVMYTLQNRERYVLRDKYDKRKPADPAYVTSPMLRRMLTDDEYAYEVTKIHAVAYWSREACNNPFRRYVSTFFVPKEEASAWPPSVGADEKSRQEYVDRFNAHPVHERMGTCLSCSHVMTEKNEGIRSVCKLCLNNLWGKLTQKEMHTVSELYFQHQCDQLWAVTERSASYSVNYIHLISGESGEEPVVHLGRTFTTEDDPKFRKAARREGDDPEISRSAKNREEGVGSPSGLMSVALGLMVPNYGQCYMHDMRKHIPGGLHGDSICYMDTDSYTFVAPGGERTDTLPMGDFLGQFKDELLCKDGKRAAISHFAALAPKTYVNLYNPPLDGKKSKVVAKGFPNSQLDPKQMFLFAKLSLLFDTLKTLSGVSQRPAPLFTSRCGPRNDPTTARVRDMMMERDMQRVGDKVTCFPDGTTLPIQHKDTLRKRANASRDREMWARVGRETQAEYDQHLKDHPPRQRAPKPSAPDQEEKEEKKVEVAQMRFRARPFAHPSAARERVMGLEADPDLMDDDRMEERESFLDGRVDPNYFDGFGDAEM